ncbi:conserved domain protein [Enterococcus faecalis TX1467]|nr:conserved domain protein [Enterococcus faecalis TX1467]
MDPFLDLFKVEILSYRISKQSNDKAILQAQKEVIDKTQAWPYRRTFHSDQGWGIPNEAVQKQLTSH